MKIKHTKFLLNYSDKDTKCFESETNKDTQCFTNEERKRGRNMIYTSYFAKIRKMPENVVPVSISQWPPKWYSGLQCKALAPTKDILMEYKNSNENDSTKEARYNERYKNEVINKIDLKQLLSSLQGQIDEDTLDLLETDNIWESKNLHIALVCFEKSGDFCHRNLVAEKLKEVGIPCRELDDRDLLELGQLVGSLYNFHER